MNRRKVANLGTDARRQGDSRWLYGINAVERRLAVRPGSIRALHLAPGDSSRRGEVAGAARRAGIPVYESDPSSLRRMTGVETHQGVVALADPFEYSDLRAILESAAGPVLVLDQIQDPHNLGALIRTAAAVGMAAVVLPRHGAAGVSAAVEKVAAGAVNDVPICQAGNLTRCLLDLRERGFWNIALVPRARQSLFDLDLPVAVALVLGGETGLRPLVERTCDLHASIPLRGGVESLNASVAGAVAMYEVARRSGQLGA